jgi:arylsulfatase A-like enzyme
MKAVGQHSRAFVELVDMYPTLAQLCGLPLPAQLEGTSFAPLLDNPDRPWKPAAFSQYLRPPSPGKPPYMGRSIRTDRWRYTEWIDTKKNDSAGVELYDEEADPAENKDVATDPANAETVKRLAEQLEAGWREVAKEIKS